MRTNIKLIYRSLALLSAWTGILLHNRLDPPFGFLVWILKVLAALFSPFVALAGLGSAAAGIRLRDRLTVVGGSLGFLLSAIHVWRVARARGDFEQAFGKDWKQRISPEEHKRMLARPWSLERIGRVGRPPGPKPEIQTDISFWTIPGTERELKCDVWQPAPGTPRNRTALLYFHSSAWCLIDKDFGTRPLFQHLTSQGYVMMDVAYRLCRETDITGMAGDVMRAVAWMKANAWQFGVDPERIILVGASAGGQLSLLAAYARPDSSLIPEDVRGRDLSVLGVVSYYGPPDMRAVRAHNRILMGTAVRLLKRLGFSRQIAWLAARAFSLLTSRYYEPLENDLAIFIETEDLIDRVMGGSPEEVPERYKLASPVTHVHPGCPPTLLVHGEHDSIVPVYSTRHFLYRLRRAGVPVVYLELPQTDHGFDMILSPFSPSMQAALYTLERFLALL